MAQRAFLVALALSALGTLCACQRQYDYQYPPTQYPIYSYTQPPPAVQPYALSPTQKREAQQVQQVQEVPPSHQAQAYAQPQAFAQPQSYAPTPSDQVQAYAQPQSYAPTPSDQVQAYAQPQSYAPTPSDQVQAYALPLSVQHQTYAQPRSDQAQQVAQPPPAQVQEVAQPPPAQVQQAAQPPPAQVQQAAQPPPAQVEQTRTDPPPAVAQTPSNQILPSAPPPSELVQPYLLPPSNQHAHHPGQQAGQQAVQQAGQQQAGQQAGQCGQQGGQPLTYQEKVEGLIARGVTRLSFNLAAAVEHDGDVSGQTGNVVFSPLNVATALALVLAGSNGTTFNEIASALGIQVDNNLLSNRKAVHEHFGRFLSQLESGPTAVNPTPNATEGSHVVVANGLFLQKEYDIEPTFNQIAASYKSQVVPVDFMNDNTRTKDLINNWFSKHTYGRIKSVLPESPPRETKLMIASALYFNGAWEAPFPIEATMVRPFNGVTANGSRELSAVRMMTNNMDLPYVADRTLGVRMLELPYRSRDASMFLVLPDADGLAALRDVERRLKEDSCLLERLIEARKVAPVIYTLPRMKLQRSISLRTALETLGVHTLFDERHADLSHLSDKIVTRGPLPAAAAPAAAATPPSGGGGHSRPSRPSDANALSADAIYFSNRNKGWANDSSQSTATPAQPASAQPASAQPASAQPVSAQPRSARAQPAVVPYAGMTPARLFADDVLHKVEVEVTETGTVASAATAITISRDGSNHVMRFNRPFIFFIRHRDTKLILFYGTVVRPMPEWIVPGVDVTKLPQPKPPGQPHRQPPPQQAQNAQPGRRRYMQPQQPAPWPAAPAPAPAAAPSGQGQGPQRLG